MMRMRHAGVALLLVALGGCDLPGSMPVAAAPAVNPGPDDGGATGGESPGSPTLITPPLVAARPVVVPVDAGRPAAAPLRTGFGDWNGELAHLAGTSHYDRGEWIYEDFPWTAYGAASSPLALVYGTLDALGLVFGSAQRIPGGLAVAITQAGAGPFVEEADLSELRFAVRGDELHVLACTTTMRDPVRTALVLLFDTGHSGAAYEVPFGTGLNTSKADTAVLVTAAGARIVDMATGSSADAPAAADATGYNNALFAKLPLARVMRDADSLRFVAATGLVAAGAYELDAGGAGGPVAKVVPRYDEPVQAIYERRQALALAKHDADEFFTDVSLARMRASDSEALRPGVGYSVRTYIAPESRGSEGGTDGILREYGLYVPAGLGAEPAPATLVFRGSSMSAHAMASVTPGWFQNLGDDNGAIVISPGGRSGFDSFQGVVYLDTMQALDDARALMNIDPERLSIAGYSMGGYATYMFAATQPDLFSGAFVVAGPSGGLQPATTFYGFASVAPVLDNLLHLPVSIFQGDVDADVPITNAAAVLLRLNALDYRYRFNLLLANTHFSPGIQNDYSVGARFIKPLRREAAPARVHFTRSMTYERAVDTASFTDQAIKGQSVGLRFDHAWFVHELEAVDAQEGVATIDVRTLARPEGAITVKTRAGVDGGPLLGQALSPYEEKYWEQAPVTDAPRNAFEMQLTGVSAVTLDLAGMDLKVSEPLAAQVVNGAAAVLKLRAAGCVKASEGGASLPVVSAEGGVALALAAGEHVIEFLPCN